MYLFIDRQGSLMVEYLLNMYEVLGSTLSATSK